MLELTGTKLSSQFNSKFNISNKQYKHDLVYFSRLFSVYMFNKLLFQYIFFLSTNGYK